MLPNEPIAPPITSTATVQVAPAASVGKLDKSPFAKRETIDAPGTAVSVDPSVGFSQSVTAFDGAATTIPGGSASVNYRVPRSDPLALLSMVKVKVLRPPNGTVDGAKLLVKPGRPASTVRSSVAVPLLPASAVRSPVRLV